MLPYKLRDKGRKGSKYQRQTKRQMQKLQQEHQIHHIEITRHKINHKPYGDIRKAMKLLVQEQKRQQQCHGQISCRYPCGLQYSKHSH